MERFGKKLIVLIGGLFALPFLLGLFVPSLRAALWAVPRFFWMIIEPFFLSDILWKIGIMILILVVGGALCLTRKEERKLWVILTAIAEFISGLLLFI